MSKVVYITRDPSSQFLPSLLVIWYFKWQQIKKRGIRGRQRKGLYFRQACWLVQSETDRLKSRHRTIIGNELCSACSVSPGRWGDLLAQQSSGCSINIYPLRTQWQKDSMTKYIWEILHTTSFSRSKPCTDMEKALRSPAGEFCSPVILSLLPLKHLLTSLRTTHSQNPLA